MRDGGDRLSFTIGKNNFSVTENLSGKSAVFSNGGFSVFTLNYEALLQKVHTIQEALMSYPRIMKLSFSMPVRERAKRLTIIEKGHYNWELCLGNKRAYIKKGKVQLTQGFDIDMVLRRINQIYATVLTYKKPLNPRYDIVRRIADAGLLVWVCNGHTVVVFENDIDGCTMANCLVDQQYYPILTVGVSVKDNRAVLFTIDLQEVVEFPVDESILRYYTDSEDMWRDIK